ncbi:MAG: hypothetical protein H0W18_04375 [Acidobacteria bacterium]|nr:hypothetical protein [Acidobacteriota bacterium]
MTSLLKCAPIVLRGSREDPAPAAGVTEQANAAAQGWRTKHEADYRHDFLSIAGLHPLKPGPNTAGSGSTNDIRLPPTAPATIRSFILEGTGVRYHPAAGVRVLLRDEPITAPLDLSDDREREADEFVIGNIRVVVHVSGSNRSLRVRDPDGPLARGFRGFTWFSSTSPYVFSTFSPRGCGSLRKRAVVRYCASIGNLPVKILAGEKAYHP